MNEIYHIPAMLRETIQGLSIQPDGLHTHTHAGHTPHHHTHHTHAFLPSPKG